MPGGGSYRNDIPGMSLRDWFAGQAFAATMAGATGLGEATDEQRAELFRQLSAIIYEGADAMLAERAKGGAA